ncbi:MAG: hypothetical protein ACC661_03900 [Verrucomicrobiales bacterium]
MGDIHFSCPHCAGSLVVDDEGAGWEVDCPHCAEAVTIPLETEREEGVQYVETDDITYTSGKSEGHAVPEGADRDRNRNRDRDREGVVETAVVEEPEAVEEPEVEEELEQEVAEEEPEVEEEPALPEPEVEEEPMEGEEEPEAKEERAAEEEPAVEEEPEAIEEEAAAVEDPEVAEESATEEEQEQEQEQGVAEEEPVVEEPEAEQEQEQEQEVAEEAVVEEAAEAVEEPDAAADVSVAPAVLPKPRPIGRTMVATGAEARGLRDRWILFRCRGCSTVFRLGRKDRGAVVSCPACQVEISTPVAVSERSGVALAPGEEAARALAGESGEGTTGARGSGRRKSKRMKRLRASSGSRRSSLAFPAPGEGRTGAEEGSPDEGRDHIEHSWLRHRDMPWESNLAASQAGAGAMQGPDFGQNRWIAVVALGVLALLSAGVISIVYVSSRGEGQAGARGEGFGRMITGENQLVGEFEDLEGNSTGFNRDFAIRTMEQATSVLTKFLEAESFEERLRHCLDPVRLRKIVEERPELKTDGPIPFNRILSNRSLVVAERSMLLLVIEDEDYAMRVGPLYYSREGYYKVDWQWFKEFSEMGWLDFLDRRPQEPVMFRLRAHADTYFNFDFSDRERFDCYRLTDSTGSYHVYGYVEKDSPAAAKLKEAIERDGDATEKGENPVVRCILRIRFNSPEPGGADQVEITDFVQRDWRSL